MFRDSVVRGTPEYPVHDKGQFMTPCNFHQEEGITKPDRYLWILEAAYSILVDAPTHTLGGKKPGTGKGSIADPDCGVNSPALWSTLPIRLYDIERIRTGKSCHGMFLASPT